MDTDKNDGEAMRSQANPADTVLGEIRDAAQQMQAMTSRFSQDDQRSQESLVSFARQTGGQIQTTDAKARENRKQIDKLEIWIRYNRS